MNNNLFLQDNCSHQKMFLYAQGRGIENMLGREKLFIRDFFFFLTVHVFFHLSQKDSPCAGAEDRPSIILWPQTDSRGLIDGVGEDVNIPPACLEMLPCQFF